MPADLNTLFNLNNTQNTKLAQIVEMINRTALDTMVRMHLVSHFEDKLVDASHKGCTPEIEALLTICFKSFNPDEIRLLIEQITPMNVQTFEGSLDDFVDFIMKKQDELHKGKRKPN